MHGRWRAAACDRQSGGAGTGLRKLPGQIRHEGTPDLDVETILGTAPEDDLALEEDRSRHHADRKCAWPQVERASGGEAKRGQGPFHHEPGLPMRDIDEATGLRGKVPFKIGEQRPGIAAGRKQQRLIRTEPERGTSFSGGGAQS